MDNMYRIQDLVFEALSEEPETRSNDKALYRSVIEKVAVIKDIDITGINMLDFVVNRDFYRLPNQESVTRARRKLQQKHDFLQADENVRAMRGLREEEYKDWSKR